MIQRLLGYAALAVMVFLTGCSSLPEGSRKPDMKIASVSLASENGESGISVALIMQHTSPEPLEIRHVDIGLEVNGRPAAKWSGKGGTEVAPQQETRLEIFVPLNLATPLARQSILNRMLMVQGVCHVKVFFTDDSDLQFFNPEQTYAGVIAHE